MGVVVADTGPLYYLVLIDQAEILRTLFSRLFIPSVVVAELTHAETPAKVREWMGQSHPWLVVRDASNSVTAADALIEKLDAGEIAAIQLADSMGGASLLLMDDRKGVQFARKRGFAVTGTLGILELAAKRCGLDLREALSRLLETNFYCSREIIAALLERSDANG